jgi:putative DNA primase/helicase
MTLLSREFLQRPEGRVFKDKVREALRRDVEGLAQTLFGTPKPARSRKEMRFAGGLIVRLAGRKRGLWYSHTAATGGAELKMIAFARHLDEIGAWGWAGHYTGIEPEGKRWTEAERRAWLERQKREREARERARRAAEERERTARIGVARQKWADGEPLEVLSEKYLVATRGIPVPEAGWPHDVIRFHRGDRAIMFAATTVDGELQAVHCVYLTGAGTNLRRVNGSKKKLTFGPLDNGAVVRLPGKRGFGAPLLRAEGPETGLTGWRATGYATWVLLGPLTNKPPPRGRRVIDLRDDDAAGSPVDQRYQEVLAGWRVDRLDVWPATPWPEPRGDKSDFNDVLREAGLDAVRHRIRLVELAAQGLEPAPPPFPPPTAGLTEVRGAVARQLAQFLRHRLDEEPPRILIAGSPGSGKTEQIIAAIPAMVGADQHQGRPHRVIVAVPMHRLGRQIIARFAERFAEAGIFTAVYEGRGVSRRESGEDEAQALADGRMALCRNPLDVELALVAGADVTKTVCGNSKSGPCCKYRLDCKYFAQLTECSKADVVFLAHNFVFERIPELIGANVGTIVIDEDPSTHGDGTVKLEMSDLGDLALDEYPVRDTRKGRKDKPNPHFANPDHAKTEELGVRFAALQSALDRVGQGTPLRDALAAEGLTGELLKEIRGLDLRRRVDPAMWPGMPLAEREEAARRASINPVLSRLHALLSACMEAAVSDPSRARDLLDLDAPSNPADPDNGCADSASERVEVRGRSITVYRLRPAASWTESRPILLASANARPELLAQHFDGLQHTPAPMPAAPFQTVHQHIGAFGREVTEGRLPELLPEAEALIAGRSALIITHLPCADPTRKRLPDVTVRYHGGTVGDDDFGNVEVVLVYGGAFPKPKDVRRLASAEAGRIMPHAKPVRTSAVALLADGTGVRFDRLAYVDETMQAVHQGIYDASIIQAIGRGRGLNRPAANPVEIHVFANCPLPLPVASITRWRRPSRLQKMLWRGNVPLGAADMHRFHPDLFRSEEAARQAKHRWGGEAEIRAELQRLADCMPWPSVLVTWQPKGQGHRVRVNLVARAQLDQVHNAALREFAGLAIWRVEPFSLGVRFRSPVEECDIAGKETSFPTMSRSSPWSAGPTEPTGDPLQPRAPPDG